MQRDKILIIDDEEMNRELLRQMFQGQYEIVTAGDGQEGLVQFQRYADTLAAVLLDLVMPRMNGYQFLDQLHKDGVTAKIPIIVITANTDVQIALGCYQVGAAEIINKPFIAGIVCQRVRNMIEMYSSREQLERSLGAKERELEKFNEELIDTLSDVVEFRDMDSGQHIKRVKGLTKIMAVTYARLYPDAGLTEERIAMIVGAAALHDIGKISIPNDVLMKPGKLTDEERKVMQAHTTKGCDILAKLQDVQDQEHYTLAYDVVRYHHERYDGRGYPDHLVADQIPLSAQLVSVADVYDALTAPRVYKKAYTTQRAYEMIMNGECGVFDPKLIATFKVCNKAMEAFTLAVKGKELR